MTTALVVLGAACGASDPSRPVAAEQAPPKVTVAGDSIALGLGVAMRDAAEDRGSASSAVVRAIGEDGTGLARPDNFDWPGRMADLARDFPPEVLVFSVGSNDAQDLTDQTGATVATMAAGAAWEAEYSERLAAVFDEFEGTSTTVLWLGHVRTTDERVADGNRRIHELATQVASTRDWVQVEDLAELTGSGDTGVSQCLSQDGLHLSPACYELAATELLARLDALA